LKQAGFTSLVVAITAREPAQKLLINREPKVTELLA
jgi:hypothetical protein